MNPGIAANQQRLFLAFLAELRPHLRRDSGLPRRINEILARHRSIGSRDRKLYRELLYTTLRFLPWIEPFLDQSPDVAAKITAWLAPELKPTSHYRAVHCGDWPPVPDTLVDKANFLIKRLSGATTGSICFDPQALLPAWFREHCPAAFQPPHLDAINRRASVWIRIQCNNRDLVLNEFRAQGWTFDEPADFSDAIGLPPNADVTGTDAYRRGFIEIQDLGSQMVLASANITPGERWLDACAGAGGKTLQLARLVGPSGQVDATDIRAEILDELRDRAKRARLDNITLVKEAKGEYDGVLVDAPCSGSGTWRRQPHLKWCVQPATISSFAAIQLQILRNHTRYVRPGGVFIYATCSLSRYENHDLVALFLKDHPHFSPVSLFRKNHSEELDSLGTTFLPGTHNTDGFYVSVMRKVQ